MPMLPEMGRTPPRNNSSELLPDKLVLLIQQQANKPRDEVLGQGIVTLFGKPMAKKMVD